MTRHGWAIVVALIGVWSPLAFGDDEADRKAIETASQAWAKAYNARDIDAIMRLVADDVVLLDPTLPPVSGHGAAHQAWLASMGRNKGVLTTTSKEIEVAGDFAWRVAALSHRHANSIDKPTQTLEIWQRVNSEWKLRRQMSSGILAPTKLLRSPPGGPMLDSRPN